jgi:hypothetical protein
MLLPVCALMALCGCGRHTYEIDLSQVPDFQWNGKLKVTKSEQMYIGPLLTLDTYWTVDRIELEARDSRPAVIDTGSGDKTPVAHVGPTGVVPSCFVGDDRLWDGNRVVLIADPDTIAGALRRTATQPATTQPASLGRFWTPPRELQPYAAHADQIGFADWWALALQQASSVSVDFALPDEGLHIVMQGNSHEYGPAIVEVRDNEGRVLRSFARQQLPVQKLDGQRR